MFIRHFPLIRNRGKRSAFLLVEDEPSDGLMLEELLLKAGHRVISEARVDRAADLLRDTAYPLAGLITAVELKTCQSGWELASLARQFRPDIPVIYLTRYSEQGWVAKGVPNSRLVEKPCDPAAVISAVKTLLKPAVHQ